MATVKLEFDVQMFGESCVEAVTNSLKALNGVGTVSVDLNKQQVFVETTLPSSLIQEAIEKTQKVAVLKGIGSTSAGPQHLGAAVAALEGATGVVGVVRFLQANENVCLIDGTIDGLETGQHGLHVYEFGDLTRGFSSMGNHYNRDGKSHGGPTSIERHTGDLGNISANTDGRAAFRFESDSLKVWDVIGRSLGVAEGRDDYGQGGNERSKIDGNCGEGVALGIIARSAGLFENPKRLCVCSGRTVWDERTEALKAKEQKNLCCRKKPN